jgi:hypothetical protein
MVVATTITLIVFQFLYFFTKGDTDVFNATSLVKNLDNTNGPVTVPLNSVVPAFYTSQGADAMIGMYWNYNGTSDTYEYINAKNCTDIDIKDGNFDKLIIDKDYVLQCPENSYTEQMTPPQMDY